MQVTLPLDDVAGPEAAEDRSDSDEPFEYFSLELVNHLPPEAIHRLTASVKAGERSAEQARVLVQEVAATRAAHDESQKRVDDLQREKDASSARLRALRRSLDDGEVAAHRRATLEKQLADARAAEAEAESQGLRAVRDELEAELFAARTELRQLQGGRAGIYSLTHRRCFGVGCSMLVSLVVGMLGVVIIVAHWVTQQPNHTYQDAVDRVCRSIDHAVQVVDHDCEQVLLPIQSHLATVMSSCASDSRLGGRRSQEGLSLILSSASDFGCWKGVFNRDWCCSPPGRGQPQCWDSEFTYQRCCQRSRR